MICCMDGPWVIIESSDTKPKPFISSAEVTLKMPETFSFRNYSSNLPRSYKFTYFTHLDFPYHLRSLPAHRYCKDGKLWYFSYKPVGLKFVLESQRNISSHKTSGVSCEMGSCWVFLSQHGLSPKTPSNEGGFNF